MTTTTPTSAALNSLGGSATTEPTIDHEAFLKLLTAQLKNQDPLAPMDATQFMTQLAQLSTVEQAAQTNRTLEEVLAALKSSGLRSDAGLIGRTVEASSDALPLVDGKASIAFAVEGAPKSVTVDVLDASGNTIARKAMAASAGRQVFEWDGRMANGSTAPDGVYRVKVNARDADGAALTAATVLTGSVAQVRSVDGTTRYVLQNGATVDADDLLAVL